MSSFEEKLQAYYKKIRSNPNLVEGINNYKSNSKRALQVLFLPSDESELLLADSVTTLLADCIEIHSCCEITIPALEDVRIASFYVDLIKAFRSGNVDEIDRVKSEINGLSPEESGEMLLDSMVVLLRNPKSFMIYIQDQSGITDYEGFMDYYRIADSAMSGFGLLSVNFEEVLVSPELLDKTSRLIGSFDARFKHIKSKEKEPQKEIFDN